MQKLLMFFKRIKWCLFESPIYFKHDPKLLICSYCGKTINDIRGTLFSIIDENGKDCAICTVCIKKCFDLCLYSHESAVLSAIQDFKEKKD